MRCPLGYIISEKKVTNIYCCQNCPRSKIFRVSWCLAPSLARYEDPLVKIYLDGHKNICGMMSLQMQILLLLTRIHGHDDTHDTRSAFCLLKWSGIRILQLVELRVNLRQTLYYFRTIDIGSWNMDEN